MSRSVQFITDHIHKLLAVRSVEEVETLLASKMGESPPKVPGGSMIAPSVLDRRWELLDGKEKSREALLDAYTEKQMECYHSNIENFIGTVNVPVGLAGPLRVNGVFAQGDYYVPLATTEAALVASYSRGCQLITECGGASAALLSSSVSRAPGFSFHNLHEVGVFIKWCLENNTHFKQVAEKTTRYGKYLDMDVTVEGNHVYLMFEFSTGDAAGQNMVTIATDAICDYILDRCPVTPKDYFVEANLSGDKKASIQSFQGVRGKKVTAEIVVPEDILLKCLHTTPKKMIKYWTMSAIGGVLSGTIGVQGHYANGLAALYIACGQDAACVAESAVGVTRFELTDDGGLYASVTLPNLIVGTVGGGTSLPTQNACLDIMGLAGEGNAQSFAEVCAVLSLAGELSITGALCSQHFVRAHKKLARG